MADSLANEVELPPLNRRRWRWWIRCARPTGRFQQDAAEDPKLLHARGPEGSTPFMYAVAYTDAATLGAADSPGAIPTAH